jgi:O-antigen/teichoic acid export membrane protein
LTTASNDSAIGSASDAVSLADSVRARFQRGLVWSVAAAVASSGSSFLLSIIVARLVGREVFGQFGLVQTTIITVSGLAQLATGYTATKYVAEFRTTAPERAGRVIALCAAVSVLTASLAAVIQWGSAQMLATVFLKAPYVAPALRLGAVPVFFLVLTGYQMGTLAGFEHYRKLAAIAAVAGLTNLVAGALGTRMWGLSGAIGGLGFGAMVQWLIFRLVIKQVCRESKIRVAWNGVWLERSLFLVFTLPAALSGLTTFPGLWLSSAFLARLPGGFSQMGLYSAASSFRVMVIFLPTLMNRVTMSILNNQKGTGNWSSYKRVFATNILLNAASVIGGILAIAAIGVPLLRLFGKDFTIGYDVLIVVLLSALPEALAVSIVQVVHSEARLWLSFFAIALPKDCSLVALAYVLTPAYGALGLAAAYTGAWTITVVSVIFVARASWPANAVRNVVSA